jgi:adenylate cyclase
LVAYDWFIRHQAAQNERDPRIVYITLTERDIQTFGKWPVSDDVLARGLSLLVQYEARMIGLDMYRDIAIPPGHEDLNAVLTGHPQIIVVTKYGDEENPGIPPPPALRGTEQVGVNDLVIDAGGVVRRALLVLDDGQNTMYSFALRLALGYLEREGIVPQPDPVNPDYLRLGQTTLKPFEADDGGYVDADARGYQILLDYRGGRAPLHAFSLGALLSGHVDRAAIRDKIVLIGSTAESVPDFFHTPYHTGFKSHAPMPGMAIHGQAVSQFLRAAQQGTKPIGTWTDSQEIVWILTWSVLGGLVGCWIRSPWNFSAAVLCGLIAAGLLAFAAFTSGLWIPLAPPVLAWLGAAGIAAAYMSNEEKKQRAVLMQLFSRHVSAEVAEAIWQDRDQFLDGGRPRSQKVTATIMFMDFRGYTAVSEKMEPQALMDWMNAYLAAMAHLVLRHNGVIDDYAGDAIKADFGVPLPRGSEEEFMQDALNAVNCALAMADELERLNRHHAGSGLPGVGMRIGINTGPVVAGSVGTAERLKYTTVGDTVNVAARLEAFDRELPVSVALRHGCRILISKSTADLIIGHFLVERVGEVSLKGKEEKVAIFSVVGRRG